MKNLKICCFYLFSLVLVTINAQDSLSRIRVEGNKFVNDQNTPVIFKGYSSSDPDKLLYDGHWNKAYFEELKAWGANVVRFPVHPAAWRRQGQNNYQRILDQGIQWAGESGLYVIIDWHSIGNLKSGLFQADMYETSLKETFEFWRAMAIRYKNNPVVACFELFNEPTVYSGQLGICTWSDWKAINEEIITIIRAHGCKAVPLVAGFNWAYDLTPIAKEPINASGIAYVSHPYPQKRDKPWEARWTADWGFAAEKYPVILTEIGFCGPDDVGAHIPVISDESYGDAIMKYTQERGISIVAWVFDPNWAPRMFSDWDFTPSRQGNYFKVALNKQ
ncbi:MAG: glycoside hydrolase family 5 protein [Saprospiraceae bacterium]|nr:glycoside hydrolase family 5 protein [Saprospiraceae bacterium]